MTGKIGLFNLPFLDQGRVKNAHDNFKSIYFNENATVESIQYCYILVCTNHYVIHTIGDSIHQNIYVSPFQG